MSPPWAFAVSFQSVAGRSSISFSIGSKGAGATCGKINHGRRVGLRRAQAPCLWHGIEIRQRRGGWRAAKFGHKAADIAAVLLEFLGLTRRVEDAEIGGCVGAAPCHPLPAHR